ncbi:glycosyltransferase family 4 protein [Crocosphaera sp.]|uniref:glycosyltransferase family 4 protein n=1 Tax=Crocosphaera sp. TaxID=2729996 RepID=UPI002579E6C4|nr:glycosyltransferase family 4 protein [Crocosphaera sp.]NQZ63031.1 glycosyltransferase family 4 protein [Crocosphaera sp.]
MKKKISVLAPDLSGGGGTRVYLLAEVLQKLNYDVKVVGCAFRQPLYPPPPSYLTVEWIPGSDYPQFIGAIWQLLQKIDGDIIYAVKPRPTSLGIAVLKKLQSRKPIILDIDDWEMSWFGGDNWRYYVKPKQLLRDIIKSDGVFRNPQYQWYLKWTHKLIKYADAITINTRFLSNKYGGTYLPHGKDTERFNPENFSPEKSREKYGMSDYKILMFPGTVRPHKGIEDILQAMDLLNREDLKLVLVGGRIIEDGYVNKLINKWQRWIIKLPQQSPEKMPEIVAAAHLIVVPQQLTKTSKAQFPIKLTDGMSMAKPILATKVGDIPEILGHTGYLVDPSSPEQLANKINWIFNHLEEAEKQGQKARERCIQAYSLDSMATILSQVLEPVI